MNQFNSTYIQNTSRNIDLHIFTLIAKYPTGSKHNQQIN